MNHLPIPSPEGVPARLTPDEEVTQICLREDFDPATEIISLDREIKDAMAMEIIRPVDAFKLRLDAYKTMMGYRYSSKKPIAQEVAGDAITNVMVVNYADVETVMTQKPKDVIADDDF